MSEPQIGTLLNERYRLNSELGRGGMGVVYRASDTLLDRDVAVKMVSALNLGTEGRARLLGEARSEFEAMGVEIYAKEIGARLSELGPG